MSSFKEFMKEKSEDPSISIHDFCRDSMLRLLGFSDTIKKKKENIPMNKTMKTLTSLKDSMRKAPDRISGGKVLWQGKHPDPPDNYYSLPERWLPTAENVSDLPFPLRKYIHDLETVCDPAGMVRENIIMKDTIAALELKALDQKDHMIAPDDPDLREFETNIGYEIEILWESGTPQHVQKSLERIYMKKELDLFICIPRKFAAEVLLVCIDKIDSGAAMLPSRMLLVSTGACFVKAGKVDLDKNDKIHLFSGSSRVFCAHSFSLERKSDRIIYRTST